MIDDFPTRFPTIWDACRTRRPRPDTRLAAGRAGRALPVGRRASPISTARRRCRTSGRAARPRAAACTAPTGSRRTRCSTVSCSVGASCEAIVAGKADRGSDRRDDRRARRRRPTDRGAGRPGRAAEGTASPTRRAARRGAARDVGRLRRRARRRRAARSRPRRSPTSPTLRRRPARSRRSRRYEVMQPAARLARDRRRGDRTRGVARRAHARRVPDSPTTRGSAGSSSAVTPCPRFVALPALAARRTVDERLRSAPRRSCSGVVAAALAEDLGVLGDITSIACVSDDQTRGRPRSSAREEGVLAGTALVDGDVPAARRRRRRASGTCTTATRSTAGTELGRVTGPLRSILTGERVALNFLCHCSGIASIDAPLRARGARQGAHPRHPQDAARACARCSAPRCAPAAASTTATRSPTRC